MSKLIPRHCDSPEENFPAPYRALLVELRAIRKLLEEQNKIAKRPVKETR